MARITMREAISQALWEEMERDPNVFIMGEEVGVWGGSYAVTRGFYDHFGPERVRDTPISEAASIGEISMPILKFLFIKLIFIRIINNLF